MPSSTMLVLPPVTIGLGRWSLPLCDATAMELAGCTVEDDLRRCASRLATALAVDPALAVWSVLQTIESSTAAEPAKLPPTISAVADPLAARLADLLTWSADAPTIAVSTEQYGRFAALVAESVGAAREATRGLPFEEAVSQPAYLTALIARWREWFEATGIERPSAIEAPPAIAGLSDGTDGVTPSLSAESRAAGDEAWRRWLAEVPGVQTLLPALVTQLRPLRELQTKFDDALQIAKLDAMKEFAYGAGHELNNPLANIATRAQTLLEGETDPERRRRLAAINTQAFRAHEMLADVMLFARPPQPRFELIDVVRLADEVVAELAEEAAAQETSVSRIGNSEPIMIEADPTQLRVALRALCINSLEALGHGGHVTIEVKGSGFRVQGSGFGKHSPTVPVGGSQSSGVTGQQSLSPSSPLHPFTPSPVQISVADDGPGIPPEIREKIFEPFFSGREAGRGLGFGLPKCWRIVTQHGGRIAVESEPGQGVKFVITLPSRNTAS